jgi:light-regulated signal transduction histidine kinase (bacteriophytochrome)
MRAYLTEHPDVVARCASLVRVVAVNKATLSLYQAHDREALLGNLTNVFTEESLPAFRDQIIALAEGRTTFSSETVTRNLAGERKTVSLKWIIVTGHEAETEQVLVAISDITDLKNAQSEIEKLNTQLEQRVRQRTALLEETNHELESFAYSVAHDLRAPLRSIEGFSQALLEDCGDMLNDRGKDHLNRVRAATQRMSEYIHSMLLLSRAGRVPMSITSVDLAAIARTVAEELRLTAPDRTVEWRLPDHLVATGDPSLLETVMRNLLENAWKFSGTRKCGIIEVSAISQPPPDRSAPRGQTFCVRDNGVGFDMAYSPKLFNAFQRLHNAEAFQGAGIGLATVRRIVSRHGGRTWAEGKPDGGAKFYVWLPDTVEAELRESENHSDLHPAPQP